MMMRLSFVVLLLFSASAQAAPPAAAPREKRAASDPAETARRAAPHTVAWVDTAPETRRAAVRAWLKMDEVTRPPFPVFAAQWRRNNATVHLSPAAAATGGGTAAPR